MATLLPSGHPIDSIINDEMDLCVWLNEWPSPYVTRVLLLFSGTLVLVRVPTCVIKDAIRKRQLES